MYSHSWQRPWGGEYSQQRTGQNLQWHSWFCASPRKQLAQLCIWVVANLTCLTEDSWELQWQRAITALLFYFSLLQHKKQNQRVFISLIPRIFWWCGCLAVWVTKWNIKEEIDEKKCSSTVSCLLGTKLCWPKNHIHIKGIINQSDITRRYFISILFPCVSSKYSSENPALVISRMRKDKITIKITGQLFTNFLKQIPVFLDKISQRYQIYEINKSCFCLK